MNGIARIREERRRQVLYQDWTPEHDDQHDKGELASAAAFYAIPEDFGNMMALWPWDEAHMKDEYDRIRQLEVAGALIAAEIDRLLRI